MKLIADKLRKGYRLAFHQALIKQSRDSSKVRDKLLKKVA